jgi:hypothetical protein
MAGPCQCLHCFPAGTREYAEIIPGGTPVHWRGTEGLIPIGPIVLKAHQCTLYH